MKNTPDLIKLILKLKNKFCRRFYIIYYSMKKQWIKNKNK